jgi:hypothetical protein
VNFALIYLAHRFFYRVFDFFRHWYADGSRAIGHRFMATLASADQSLALKITLRHFFEPLYKDYTVIGRILGIIFRSGRIAIGAVVYVFLASVFAIVYLIWLFIPVGIILYGARSI